MPQRQIVVSNCDERGVYRAQLPPSPSYHLLNAGPPIKIERVDVPVRLERRLAALLQDLPKHKRMNINSCLEEMLLHTNEDVGPHTQTTIHYIQELKKKHGIDYDCHASYRFVEE